MKSEDLTFIAELYSKINSIEEFIRESGMEHRVMAGCVIGLMEEYEDMDVEDVEMKSIFSFNLRSRSELEVIKSIMDEAYVDDEDTDLDDMLRDLGISLN